MAFYWKVRLYRPDGTYGHSQVKTDKNLSKIDTITQFYENLTNSKMLLEGMSENPYPGLRTLSEVFLLLFENGIN